MTPPVYLLIVPYTDHQRVITHFNGCMHIWGGGGGGGGGGGDARLHLRGYGALAPTALTIWCNLLL